MKSLKTRLLAGMMLDKISIGAITAAGLLMATPAWAGGSGMPWETPLQSIVDSVQGPVAKVIGVIIIVITGLTLAFGDTAGGFRRLIQIVFGLSVAFAASSFFLSFFSFGGGLVV
jgi:type IV secretion system protein VirB2